MEMKELGEKLREAYKTSCLIVEQETPPAFFGSDTSIVPEVIHLSQTLFNVWSRGVSFSEFTKKSSTYVKRKGKSKSTIVTHPEPANTLEDSAAVSVLNITKTRKPDEFSEWEHAFLSDMAEKIEREYPITPKQHESISRIWMKAIENGIIEDHHEKWEVET